VRTAIPEEARNHACEIAVSLVHSHFNFEVASFWIAQDPREGLGVSGRRSQLL
jgi:hypothetical protein